MAVEYKAQVLSYIEIEDYIESLSFYPLDQIGSIRWFSQHEMLEKLNLQALCEVKMCEEEVVRERFLFFEKSDLLVEILIAQTLWSERVFPNVLISMCRDSQAFPTYMILFHAVTVASLLECLTYSESFCQALDESALDLLDFCHAAIGGRIADKQDGAAAGNPQNRSGFVKQEDNPEHQLANQKREINAILSAKSVGILCHLAQHASSLSLSITTRMCDHHDLPIFLAGLLENNPWTVDENGMCRKFIDGEWREILPSDRHILTRLEGQLWIALHQCLLNPDCMAKYYLNQFRKTRLMKVTAMLNEVLLDQLPVLGDLQRYLVAMSFMEAPVPKRSIILEQTPAIRARILANNKVSWEDLARRHVNTLSADVGLLKVIAGRMADIYSTDNMEQILPEPAKCACCGHPAKSRCSGCKMEWYCRRECQVQQWPRHKAACGLLVQS